MKAAFLVLMAFGASTMPDDTRTMAQRNAEILQLLIRLSDLGQKDSAGDLRAVVAKELSPIEDSEDLRRVALLARNLVSGRAEDAHGDRLFWDAFWVCATRLSERDDEWSGVQLTLLSEGSYLGGGDRLALDRLLQRQEANRGKHRTREKQ